LRILESIAYGQPIDALGITGEDLILPETRWIKAKKAACMLSGGIDSSLIAANLAQRVEDVTAYTLVWRQGDDEERYAKRVADILGIEHRVVYHPIEEFIEFYDEISKHGPHARPAYWPVLRAAKKDGYDVIYSGEGGDETYLGYMKRYRHLQHWQTWRWIRPATLIAQVLPGKYGRYARIVSRPTWCEFVAAQQTRVRDIEMPERFRIYDDPDWVVASMNYDYAKLLHYVDMIRRMAEGLKIKVVMPIMGRRFTPEKWRSYWDGKTPYGKIPLVMELKRICPEAARIATRKKHGFSPPSMEKMWEAGLKKRIIDTLRASPLLQTLRKSRILERAIDTGEPKEESVRRALTEAYTIHRYLSAQ